MEQKDHFVSWLVCAMLLSVIPFSESFEVFSSQTVTGTVDQDVVLPCQISTGTQPDNMEVQWKKMIQTQIETVYEYQPQTGRDMPGQRYQGQAILLKDGFTSGNVSLKLKNVRPTNEGMYSCIVKSNAWSADAATKLQIAAVAAVSINVLGPQDKGIGLACRSGGWFPKPELRWVTKQGQDLHPVTKMDQDSEHLFRVLSNVTVLGEETGEISCIIRNSLLKTEQKSIIFLAGDIFPRVSPWLAAFWILFTLGLLVIGACVLYGYLAKQKKSSKEGILLLQDGEMKTLQSEREDLRQQLDRTVSELDFRRARSYMVPITLDLNYKHPEVTVSEDGRTIQHSPRLPEPAAPSGALIAIGKEMFVYSKAHGEDSTVSRWYWEVEVGDSLEWELGVLSESVRQKMLDKPTEGGWWALGRSQGQYHPKDADTVIQQWDVKPIVIGVYLDLERGNLSFYNVNAMSLILEIPVNSSQRLFPFLSPGHTMGMEQGKPLSICPPSDWDFVQKVAVPGNQGFHITTAKVFAPNNKEGAENKAVPSARGETASGPGQHPASGNQDVKKKIIEESIFKNLQKFSLLNIGKGNKSEQEHLSANREKEKTNLKISKAQQDKRNQKKKNTQYLNLEEIPVTNAAASDLGTITGKSDPNADTLEKASPQIESGNGDTLDVSSLLDSKENCST